MGKIQKKKIIKTIALIFLSIFALIILIFVSDNITESKKDGTKKIIENIAKLYTQSKTKVDNGSGITPDYIDSEYYSELYINTIGNDKHDDDEYAVSVSRYKNNETAQLKSNIISEWQKYIKNKIEGTSFELNDEYKRTYYNCNDIIIVRGKYLINIDGQLYNDKDAIIQKVDETLSTIDNNDEEQANDEELNNIKDKMISSYESEVDKNISDYDKQANDEILEYVQKIESCKNDDCDNILNKVKEFSKYKNLTASISKVEEKYKEVIENKETISNSITNSISNLKKSLNQVDFDLIKKQIDSLDDKYYDSYKIIWEKDLNSLEASVFKNSCSKYNYKDLLRYPAIYKGKNVYWFGKVLQKINSSEYRVGVDCKKYQYIGGYYCDNTIYVIYYGNISLIEDDMIKIWGTMNDNTTYETIMGANLTIPNINAKYVELQ